MRLKSKYVTLVALVLLTATPRAFDQLANLKHAAQERFRAELLNIFWTFTTPESRRVDARQYSELLARMQASATDCNSTNEIKATRGNRTFSFARATPKAADLGHRQPLDVAEPSEDNFVADISTEAEQNWEFTEADDAAAADGQKAILIARNFTDYPIFDETYGPVRVDDQIAQLQWRREAEPSALPRAKPAAFPKRELPDTQRFARKFVETNIQIRLSENFDAVLNKTIINSNTLIKIHAAPAPAKPKCRVTPAPVAPEEAPRPLEKPAVIS
ncbi:MAG TPA: hypothetical protein VF658_17320 [Pyrinomonadaceae bacterium]|jgi:hypothetical protein